MNLELVTSNQHLMELYPRLMSSEWCAIDTETTGLDIIKDLACGICLSVDGENGYYVPFAHTTGPQCSIPVVEFVVETLVRNPNVVKVFHNLKYDMHIILNTFGIKVIPPYHDSMAMGFIVDNTVYKGLKPWAERLFGSDLPSLKEDLEMIKSSRRIPTYAHFTPEEISDYGAADAVFTFKLAKTLLPEVESNQQLSLYHMEMELMDLVFQMERNGTLIDQEFLIRAGEMLDARLPIAQKELETLINRSINTNSPKQVSHLLYDELKMPVLLRTAKGNPSCAEEVLLNLPTHPVIPLILECRTLGKIKSTYVDGLLEKLGPDGRVHGRFNQFGADTGRFSSSEPNLQNIPREGSVPVSIRGAFVAPEGKILAFLDYSQVEMRLFAHYSGDPGLIGLVHEGYDFHLATAAIIFNKHPDQVTKEERKFAKKVNFGYIYGIGKKKLARDLQITQKEAEAFLKKYNAKFPAVPTFMEEQKRAFIHKGFVENLFGRRRLIPWDKSYRAVNTLIQGSAADVLKIGGVKVNHLLRSTNILPLMTIHDEFVFEVPLDELEIIPEIKSKMEEIHLRVPIRADVEWSDTSWAAKRKWEKINETYTIRD